MTLETFLLPLMYQLSWATIPESEEGEQTFSGEGDFIFVSNLSHDFNSLAEHCSPFSQVLAHPGVGVRFSVQADGAQVQLQPRRVRQRHPRQIRLPHPRRQREPLLAQPGIFATGELETDCLRVF